MIFIIYKVLANFVPAAAVKREGLVLFESIGRKELLGCKFMQKYFNFS